MEHAIDFALNPQSLHAANTAYDPKSSLSLPPSWVLTPSESRVVRLLAAGRTTAEMAQLLGLSVHTVRTHVKRAMAKAGVHTQVSLVASLFAAKP